MSNKNKKHKQLPLHSNEAHPLTCAGEVNKQFVIAMIALAAIVVLALLLLFSEQFVGKAIYAGAADTGGVNLISPGLPQLVKNKPFALSIGANIGGKTKIISFTLILPKGLTCGNLEAGGVKNLLPNVFQETAKCEYDAVLKESTVVYEYYTLGVGDNLAPLSGVQDLAEIRFSGAPTGEYEFVFKKFDYFDQDLKQEIKLAPVDKFVFRVKECEEGLTFCNGQCVNLQADKSNCGQCSKVCEGLASCKAGSCVSQCIGETPDNCNNVCVNLKMDMKNCGQCGKVCALQACVGGICIEKKCGNNKIDAGENCDGLNLGGKSCSDLGFGSGALKCDLQCQFDIHGCIAKPVPKCGNNQLDPGEECDSPPDNSGFFSKGCNALGFDGGTIQCTKECKLDTTKCNPKPGEELLIEDQDKDGVPADEDCDDTDPYLGACSVNEACVNGKCTLCGNNLLDEGEKCDSINLDGKSCFDFDFDGGLLQCSLDCTSFDTSKCNPKPVQPAVDAGGVQAPAAGIGAEAGGAAEAGEGAVAGGALPAAGAVNATGVVTPVAQAVTGAVQGTKITLTDIAPVNNVYSTQITATEDFTNEVTVYTVLYGANNKVLSIKLEKIEAGLKKGTAYTATVNYPLGNVNKKSVIVYDVELKPSIYGTLTKAYVSG